jgi:histidine triad (HIT) family protein
MEDCVFCKIARGEIPASKVYEDDNFLAFLDIEPQAKRHILVIPKVHIEDAAACFSQDPNLLSALFLAAVAVAKREGLEDGGYRIVTNVGENARQSVPHLHVHLLGGEKLNARMS